MTITVAVAVAVDLVAPVAVAGRVALGDRSPRAPTDPDLRDSRIRLLSREVRRASVARFSDGLVVAAAGSGGECAQRHERM